LQGRELGQLNAMALGDPMIDGEDAGSLGYEIQQYGDPNAVRWVSAGIASVSS